MAWDVIGDLFGTAAQVLIEDWWRDPKKRWIALSLFALTIILVVAGVIYSLP
ncbi:MAG TPA: hypothetical protein VJH22_00795 [Candidatus Nanoarchaeia archaeon]|nr:hypothetical protein [Candidatus Nanoarchaeia archaeon]